MLIHFVAATSIALSFVNTPAFVHQNAEPKEKSDDVMTILGKQIYFRGTPSYKKKLKEFSIDLEEAKKIVLKVRTGADELDPALNRLKNEHNLIVDDFFVFPDYPFLKSHLPYSGVCVNGKTGDVFLQLNYKAISWGSTMVPRIWFEVKRKRAKQAEKERAEN